MTLLFASVYRDSNAARLGPFLDAVNRLQGRSRLWALDHVSDGLSAETIGQGNPQGASRFGHLNACIADARRGETVVICDDDVEMTDGDFERFLALAGKYAFDVAAPAHSSASTYSHPFLAASKGVEARLVSFCEIGPLVAFSATALPVLYPFPTVTRFGHGVDIEWAATAARVGLRLGVIDKTPVTHLGRPGSAYSDEELGVETRVIQTALARYFPEHRTVTDIQRTIRAYS